MESKSANLSDMDKKAFEVLRRGIVVGMVCSLERREVKMAVAWPPFHVRKPGIFSLEVLLMWYLKKKKINATLP